MDQFSRCIVRMDKKATTIKGLRLEGLGFRVVDPAGSLYQTRKSWAGFQACRTKIWVCYYLKSMIENS